MAELAWLAPISPKDVTTSRSSVSVQDIFRISSKPDLSGSAHKTDENDNLQYASSSFFMDKSKLDTKWKPNKLPQSALKGAWSYQEKSRPKSSSDYQGGHRSEAMAVFNLTKNRKGHPGSGSLNGRSAEGTASARRQGGRSGEEGGGGMNGQPADSQMLGGAKGGKLHVGRGGNLNSQSVDKSLSSKLKNRNLRVDGGDSVNRRLEDNISNLQNSLLKGTQSKAGLNENHQNAEFVQLSYTGIASSDDRRSGYRGPRGASDFNTRKGGKGGRGKGGYGNNGDGDDDNNGGRYGNGNGEDDNNGGRYGNGNGGDDDDLDGFRKRSKLGGVGVSDSKYHLKKGMSQGSLQDEPEFIIEDLEKDQSRHAQFNFADGQHSGEDRGERPAIVIDSADGSDGQGTSLKRIDELIEARWKKLKLKMKYANTFDKLFQSTRAESKRTQIGLDGCYNPKDVKLAKFEEKKASERDKVLSAISPNLPPGLPFTITEGDSTRARAFNYASVAEAGKYTMSPESLKSRRETLGDKRPQLFNEQPWLLGRLALSKETCRFELPMDLRILTKISPMEYLTRYSVISSRRKNLYKMIFQKFDKDRDGWISYKELIKGLKEIHVSYIDKEEIDQLSQMLILEDDANAKFSSAMFAGISAFSERLLLHIRKDSRPVDPFEKEKLEEADFDNMKWKLRNVEVNPPLMKVLQTL